MAAAALVQGDAYPARGLHLELVHGRAGLGDHDPAVGRLAAAAGHNRFRVFSLCGKRRVDVPGVRMPGWKEDILWF